MPDTPTCDYCDQPATRRAVDCDDLLCDTDAQDQYESWQESTRSLTSKDIMERMG
jgi:hypothetical protein